MVQVEECTARRVQQQWARMIMDGPEEMACLISELLREEAVFSFANCRTVVFLRVMDVVSVSVRPAACTGHVCLAAQTAVCINIYACA
jgi:hypothetical protein